MKNGRWILMDEECEEPSDDCIVDNNNVDGNTIYFYSEVNRDKTQELISSINTVHRNLSNIDIEIPINIRIFSSGGHPFSGLILCDKITKYNFPIYTFVDGMCASAATLFSIVGDRRFISENSYMLIHQMSAWMMGSFKHSEITDEKENIDKLMMGVIKIYEKHTTFPKNKMKELLKRDLYLDSKECLKYGLVDEIL